MDERTMKWRFHGLVLALCIMGSAVSASVQASMNSAAAETFIVSLAEKAVNALTQEDTPRPEKIRRFRELLHEHFDVKRIGAWVLGRYWPAATEDEKQEYLDLFEQLIISTYVDRFSTYSGETLTVTGAAIKGEEALVSSRLKRPAGGEPIDVEWRLQERAGALRIIDVTVEGISMGQTQRSEFASVIRNKGGQVSGLIEELRKHRLPN